MNIEEARAAIEEAAMCLANGPECHPSTEAWRDLNAAVRAGFLAVMEEAKGCVIPHGDLEQWDDEVLRSRIEELGK